MRSRRQRLAARRFEVALALVLVEDDLRHVQRIEIPAHRRQRGPQLVRDVGEHLPAQPIGEPQRFGPLLQVRGHVIERGRHASDLVASLCGRARIELAGAEPLRRLLEGAQTVARRREDDERGDGGDGDERQRPGERQQLADVRRAGREAAAVAGSTRPARRRST